VSRLRRDPPVTWGTLRAVLGAELAVVALLELIRRRVGNGLHPHVIGVWIAGRQTVRHTQALHLLNATQQRTRELVEELERRQQSTGGRIP
jgi:hypothetical protein